MSTATRPDFAQKLLNDLKMRKERMATQSSSIMSADTHGSSRRSLKSSTDMKSIAKTTSNTSKLQRPSSRSQSARMSVENPNQIVPYGDAHASNQPLDLSMTLSYALDDNGKLKNMNLTGSSAMIGFLRQISRRSMDDNGSSQIQWPSSTRFPTLTSLHVDEVSKGAQRLNHILKSFYNGLSNNNSNSVDMGKELLKGAVELEESLRMLVSLQEASECAASKSRVKLIEMGEEKDEASQKRVEKPVFSFDKRVKEATHHRRSASSPVTSSSSTNKPGRAGIPNVVAKLMGLEEIPCNNQLIQEGTRNNKIVILTSNKFETLKEIDERNSAWSQREEEKIMTRIMQLNTRSGVKERASPKDEVQRTENLVQGKRVSVRDGRMQHPKSPQRVETQGKNKKLEERNSKKIEASEKVTSSKCIPKKQGLGGQDVRTLTKDIHEVKSAQQEEVKLQENESNNNKVSEAAVQKVGHSKKMVKSGPNQKANEVMAKPGKSANRPSRAMKQQATILQGLKQRKPVNKGSQKSNIKASRRVESGANTDKDMEAKQARSNCNGDEFQSCEALHSNQDVNLKLPCDQLDQPLMPEKDPESKPQTSELIQLSDTQETHQKKEALPKVDIQQPLTDDEIYLKQILITSQVFLNTAEALFKLNIPIGILNASDITCQEEEKDTKLTTDCAYEMLKMKGKRRELVFFYPCKNALISNMRLKTLDDLVRQLHKDFENLRTYGKTRNSDNDQAEYLLKMLERDMYHKDMDVNCMWDMGWNDSVFAYVEMDEVVRGVEKCMINEVLDEVLRGFMEISVRSCVTAC